MFRTLFWVTKSSATLDYWFFKFFKYNFSKSFEKNYSFEAWVLTQKISKNLTTLAERGAKEFSNNSCLKFIWCKFLEYCTFEKVQYSFFKKRKNAKKEKCKKINSQHHCKWLNACLHLNACLLNACLHLNACLAECMPAECMPAWLNACLPNPH